jgi:hypothetical protein
VAFFGPNLPEELVGHHGVSNNNKDPPPVGVCGTHVMIVCSENHGHPERHQLCPSKCRGTENQPSNVPIREVALCDKQAQGTEN